MFNFYCMFFIVSELCIQHVLLQYWINDLIWFDLQRCLLVRWVLATSKISSATSAARLLRLLLLVVPVPLQQKSPRRKRKRKKSRKRRRILKMRTWVLVSLGYTAVIGSVAAALVLVLVWLINYTRYTHLTALCSGLPGWADTRKVKPN